MPKVQSFESSQPLDLAWGSGVARMAQEAVVQAGLENANPPTLGHRINDRGLTRMDIDDLRSDEMLRTRCIVNATRWVSSFRHETPVNRVVAFAAMEAFGTYIRGARLWAEASDSIQFLDSDGFITVPNAPPRATDTRRPHSDMPTLGLGSWAVIRSPDSQDAETVQYRSMMSFTLSIDDSPRDNGMSIAPETFELRNCRRVRTVRGLKQHVHGDQPLTDGKHLLYLPKKAGKIEGMRDLPEGSNRLSRFGTMVHNEKSDDVDPTTTIARIAYTADFKIRGHVESLLDIDVA